MGIEDRKVSDHYLTASSEWNRYHGARFGRLNAVARGRNKGAWSAKKNNRRQYIMVSFTHNISFVLSALDFIGVFQRLIASAKAKTSLKVSLAIKIERKCFSLIGAQQGF